jgi:hypothetical protein
MKPSRQSMLAVALFLSACVDHWDGGGRRQELPSDERMSDAIGGASSDARGTTAAGLEPDQGSGASASSDAGAAGGGGLADSAGSPSGLGSAGTAEIPNLP